MNQRRLFIASCLSLVVTAMIFVIRGDIAPAVEGAYGLSHEQYAFVSTMAFFGFAASILAASPMLDALGMRNLLYLALVLHIGGILAFITAPSYTVLYMSMLFAGFGNGLVEAVINPLTATVYPTEKVHKLNVLHAWWPGGLIIGGLIAYLMGLMNLSWQVKMGIVIIPTVIYGFMIFGQKFPQTERAAAGISTGEMFKTAVNPAFLLLLFCMMLTASIELGPGQLLESVLRNTAGMSGTMVFVYGSALMFVLRYFAGPIAHKLSPIGMMCVSVLLAGIGLFLLAGVTSPAPAYFAATIFYVGVCFMWPTMLGITSERFPRGGALTMGLMGFAGQFALGVIILKMGAVFDAWGAAEVFRFVSKLAIIPLAVFAVWWFKDYGRGGYQAFDVYGNPVEVKQSGFLSFDLLRSSILIIAVSFIASVWGYWYTNNNKAEGLADAFSESVNTYTLARWAMFIGGFAFLVGVAMLVGGLVKKNAAEPKATS